MPKADTTPTTSRRTALAGQQAGAAAVAAAKTAAATPASSATTADHPDFDVIQIAERIMARDAEFLRLVDEEDKLPDFHARRRFNEERIRPLVADQWELRIRLAMTPATTMAGFLAKARVVQRFNNCSPGYADPSEDGAVAWSLANDLLGVLSVWQDNDGEARA